MEARTQPTTHATMLGSAKSTARAPLSSDTPPPPLKAESRNLSFHYGKFQALKGITMPVHEHKVTALIGPSGCGKSTFLRCFNRMHDLYAGNRYDGEIVLHPDNTNLLDKDVDPIEVRMRVSMVFRSRIRFRRPSTRTSPMACACAASNARACWTRKSRIRCVAPRCGTR